MGLLGNILSDAISNGVKKGIGNALEKAVESAVKPAADRLAEKGAEHINAAAEAVSQNTAEIKKASADVTEATLDAKPAEGGLGGFAGLGAALSGLASQAEKYATEMSKNIKICPTCGEACGANNEFCPSCGAKLPEQTAADEYTCPKCGEVNIPGHTHCTKCGATLPSGLKAEAESASAIEKFAAACPQYPAWTAGGAAFELTDDDSMNGHPIYRLHFKGGVANVEAYEKLLLAAGFQYQNGRTDADTLFKVIDGTTYAFNSTDAVCDHDVTVAFFVDPEVSKMPEQPAAQPDIDVAKLAKGIFKKLF